MAWVRPLSWRDGPLRKESTMQDEKEVVNDPDSIVPNADAPPAQELPAIEEPSQDG